MKPRSRTVRKPFVTGMPSFLVVNAGLTALRCTLKGRDKRFCFRVEISTGPGPKPPSPQRTAADLWQATASGPPHRQAALSRCSQVCAAPPNRKTLGSTSSMSPASPFQRMESSVMSARRI